MNFSVPDFPYKVFIMCNDPGERAIRWCLEHLEEGMWQAQFGSALYRAASGSNYKKYFEIMCFKHENDMLIFRLSHPGPYIDIDKHRVLGTIEAGRKHWDLSDD